MEDRRRQYVQVVEDVLFRLVMVTGFAVPSFAMAARLNHVWRAPQEVDNGQWVRRGVGIFAMEFILLHAGTLIGTTLLAGADGAPGRMSFAGLVGLYGLFAVAVSQAFSSAALLSSFLWLVAGRFIAVALGTARQDAEFLVAHSVVAMAIYFALVVVSVFAPVPRRGITESIAAQQRVADASGIWVEQPHRAIGAATIYFFLLGLAEVGLLSWVDPSRFIPR